MTEDPHSDATDELTASSGDGDEHSSRPELATAREFLRRGTTDGSLLLAGGGLFLLGAVRSLARGQIRTLPKALLGGSLIGIGLRQRRNTEDPVVDDLLERTGIEGKIESSTIDDIVDDYSSDGSTEQSEKSVSDDAFTATQRSDIGSQPQEGAAASDTDPGQNTDDQVDIDVSDAALADESGEATGPDAGHSQPSQTEGTEPEPEPDEDVSHVQTDTPDGREDDEQTREREGESTESEDET